MSYNGSGTFQINTSGQPVVTGTVISSSAFNALTADLATGLSTAITKDGQTATTVRIPFAQGINSTLATDATSTSTGSIYTAGGVGIAKALYVGTTANIAGTATVDTITSKAATALTLQSAGTTALTLNTNQALGVGSSPAFGTTGQILTSAGTGAPPTWANANTSQIQPISASVASNALTISASALTLDFRSTTLGSGTVTAVAGTPSNLVVPSTATLGTVSGVQSRLIVLAMNNAGTIELAVVNIAGSNNLDETTLISTSAIAGGSNSASTIYSTTARSSLAFRVIGFIESTQATAGTWATAPSTIQGYGGNALNSMSSLGYGQTYQNVSRSNGTTYYNTTGKPITTFYAYNGGASLTGIFVIAGFQLPTFSPGSSTAGLQFVASAVVPPGASYVFTTNGSFVSAVELR